LREHRGPPPDDDHPGGRRPPHALDVREQLGARELLPLAGGRAGAGVDGRSLLGAVVDRAGRRVAEHAVRGPGGVRRPPEHPRGAAGGGHGGRRVAVPDPRPRHLPVPPAAGPVRPHHPVDGRVPHLRPGVRDDGGRPRHDDPDHHLLQLRDGLPDAPDGPRLGPRRRHAPDPLGGHRVLDLPPLPAGEGRVVSRRRRPALPAALGRALVYLALLAVVLVSLFPIYFALTTSLKSTRDAFTTPPTWIFRPTLEHHRFIWLETPFPRYLVNTLVITTGTVILS